jgi:16S rRNA (adenine1518-N6/adenine1519-N6)-dimethyltransferase
MEPLYQFVKNTMKLNRLKFTKSLGQNFLIDDSVLEDIIKISGVCKEDYVLEVGPGIGVLTRELCENAKKVVVVEIDNHIIDTLKKSIVMYDNVEIINDDILKIDINKIKEEYFDGNDFKLVANLPYYITTPIIMGILENNTGVKSITVMVQKEVADRMVAKKGKAYGVLSVAVQYYGQVSIDRIVPPTSFMPSPKVHSAVVKIDVYEKPQISLKSKETFFKIVKSAFNQRRKTIVNSLSASPFFDGSKEYIKEVLTQCEIDLLARPETLSIDDFANISNNIQ